MADGVSGREHCRTRADQFGNPCDQLVLGGQGQTEPGLVALLHARTAGVEAQFAGDQALNVGALETRAIGVGPTLERGPGRQDGGYELGLGV